MTDVLVKYWTNFAKYGTPSPPSQIEDDLPVWRTFSVDQVRPTNIQYWQTENYYESLQFVQKEKHHLIKNVPKTKTIQFSMQRHIVKFLTKLNKK